MEGGEICKNFEHTKEKDGKINRKLKIYKPINNLLRSSVSEL
jgi:hypothetical protein